MTLRTTLTAFLLLLAIASPATANFIEYRADLNGSSETPANASPGVGIALVTIDLDATTMRVRVSFSGLEGNVTASHIHCCISTGNTGVATMLPSFADFPLGVTSGTYDHTFDMSDSGNFNPAFVTNHGGTVSSAFNALVAGLDADQAYLNIHTQKFTGGEIRGFLQACDPNTHCPNAPAGLPEPTSLVLLGAALAGLGVVTFRRRSARAC